MALQGTLDTFELPDVLRLLASTRKTGRLELQSDRGLGSVWLDAGQVVAADVPGGDASVGDAIFELLRATEGSFAFDPGGAPSHAATPTDVEPLLHAAEAQLVEWREIERVVPSLRAWLGLASVLPGDDVTIDAATWRLVATIGSGMTVGDVGRALQLAEVPVSRLVRDLVVRGLATVSDVPSVDLTATLEPDLESLLGERWSYADDAPAAPAFSSVFEVPEPSHAVSPFEPEVTLVAPAPEPVPEAPAAPAPVATIALDAHEADEVARQLAMLSPRAAQAVAAAAAADSDAAREAALDAFDGSDEPINRDLLLKFLSSVKS